jgi:DNA mismatch endonuclease, patch repair protein
MERVLRDALKNGKFTNVTPVRSATMSRVRGSGNRTTELRLRSSLVRNGISGWNIQVRNLPGKPDFYFRKARVAVFVDGCFWHACRRCGHVPKNNQQFWKLKFNRNRQRAQRVSKELSTLGIKPMRFWEHDIVDHLGRVVLMIKNQVAERSKQGRSKSAAR